MSVMFAWIEFSRLFSLIDLVNKQKGPNVFHIISNKDMGIRQTLYVTKGIVKRYHLSRMQFRIVEGGIRMRAMAGYPTFVSESRYGGPDPDWPKQWQMDKLPNTTKQEETCSLTQAKHTVCFSPFFLKYTLQFKFFNFFLFLCRL